MQEVRVEDWLRVHRELRNAERVYSERRKQYADGRISDGELQAARDQLQAKRALTEAISSRAFGLAPQRPLPQA